MRSKHEGYDSVRSKVISTASGLFTRTGVHGTSLNDIAAAADIAKGTVYYYYPTKEELTADVAQCYCDSVTDALLNWVENVSREAEPESQLLLLAKALLNNPARRKLHAVLFAEGCLDDPAVREIAASSLEKWTVMFEVGALKLRLPQARQIRAHAGLFFTLLGGYMLKPEVTREDMTELARLMIG